MNGHFIGINDIDIGLTVFLSVEKCLLYEKITREKLKKLELYQSRFNRVTVFRIARGKMILNLSEFSRQDESKFLFLIKLYNVLEPHFQMMQLKNVLSFLATKGDKKENTGKGNN